MSVKGGAPTPNAAAQMDRMYRWTRHVYDASRKYFLLGRDRLLDRMDVRPGDRVLEVGCGTARNLILLAHKKRGQNNALYGLDAAEVMLETAREKAKAAGLGGRIVLKQCLAEQLDYRETFGLNAPFEVIFFSYSLSMIPTWEEAIQAALRNLKPGRSFYIVDFWDQAELPGWFQRVLVKWLDLFHVKHRPELIEYLHALEKQGRGRLTLEPVGGRYSFIARFDLPGE